MSFASVIQDARLRLTEGGPRTSYGRKYNDVAEAAAEVATSAAERLIDLEKQQVDIDGMLRGTENLVEHARNIVTAAEINVHQQAENLHAEVSQLRAEMAQWRQEQAEAIAALEQARVDATIQLAQANSVMTGAKLFIKDREDKARIAMEEAVAAQTLKKEERIK